MVNSVVIKKETIFICEDCGLKYKKEQLAKKCEEFCKRNNACSLEITKYAINYV